MITAYSVVTNGWLCVYSLGGAADITSNAQVVEFGRNGAKAGLDVPQAFPAGQLRKRHAQELVETGEGSTRRRSGYCRTHHQNAFSGSGSKTCENTRTPEYIPPSVKGDLPPNGDSKTKSFPILHRVYDNIHQVFTVIMPFLTGQQ